MPHDIRARFYIDDCCTREVVLSQVGVDDRGMIDTVHVAGLFDEFHLHDEVLQQVDWAVELEVLDDPTWQHDRLLRFGNSQFRENR